MKRCRFIAFTTRSVSPKAVDVPRDAQQFTFGPLTVWLETGCPYLLFGDGRGLLVGDLFDRTGAAIKGIDPDHAEEIASTAGDQLVQNYWGQYCCFFLDRQDRVISIRDPSGGVPCYYYEGRTSLWQCALVDDLIGTGVCDGAIDPAALSKHLIRTQLREPRSALHGISEMTRGQRITFTRGSTEFDFAWNPSDFTRPNGAVTFEDAAASVRGETLRCIAAHASRFEHLLVDVSGGLDSSILAAGLQSAGATATLVTFESGIPRDDERPFARAVARHLGYPLIEAKLNVSDINLARSAASHLPRPLARSFAQSSDVTCQHIAAQIGCDASFNGAGGDNIFFNLSTADPIVEQIQVQGVSLDVFRTARAISHITQSSIIAVLQYGWRRWKKRHDPIAWGIELGFLAGDVLAQKLETEHPWMQLSDLVTPGRQAHVGLLMRIENHLEGFGRELMMPVVSPLLSQPLVELCLGLPSWLWVHGGVNRAIARRAFIELLPPQIIERRGHGSPIGFASELYERRKKELLSLLIDGWLSREHLIESAEVERYLRDPRPAKDLRFLRILELADIEAWARAREERRGSAGIFKPFLQIGPVADFLG